ncbi:MAG: HlyD family efflux transporter periplasmic adaptor subunit [Chromatocurvus sp.]
MIIRARLSALKSRIHRKNALFVMAASAGMLTTTLLMATAPEQVPQEVTEKAWPVSTTLVEVDRFVPELQVFGRVESPRHTQLSSALDTPVRTVHVSEGDSVQAGKPLVTLDTAEAELVHAQRAADLAGKQASLESLQSDFASEERVLGHMQALQELAESRVTRLTDLYARRLVSTTEVDALRQEVALRTIELSRQQALVQRQPQRLAGARAAVQSAAAALAEQQIRLERSILRAPFDGRITRVSASEGDRVQPGKILVALYDSAGLRLRARLPSTLAAELRSLHAAGTHITATIAGHRDIATLANLSGEIEAGSSGVDAFFDLPSDSALEIGRTVEITLKMPAVEDVAALPQQSLHDSRLVYAVEDGRLQAIPVTTHGTRRNSLGGLDVLVSSPALRDGAEVLISDMPQARQGLLVNATRPRPGRSDDRLG